MSERYLAEIQRLNHEAVKLTGAMRAYKEELQHRNDRVRELEANQLTADDKRVLASLLEWLTNDEQYLDVVALCDGWRVEERLRIQEARDYREDEREKEGK